MDLCRTGVVGTGPLFVKMSNRPGFQIDLFLLILSHLFLPRALESARTAGGIRLV